MLAVAASGFLMIGAFVSSPAKVYVTPFPVQLVIPTAASSAESSGSIIQLPADETLVIQQDLRKHCSDSIEVVNDVQRAQFRLVMRKKREGTDLLSPNGDVVLHIPVVGKHKIAERACQFIRMSSRKP